MIIASDILLYYHAYPALLTTLARLMCCTAHGGGHLGTAATVRPQVCYMSWTRRVRDEHNDPHESFFTLAKDSGLFDVENLGGRIWAFRAKCGASTQECASTVTAVDKKESSTTAKLPVDDNS